MATFIYKVKDEIGRVYTGVSQADDMRILKKTFRDRSWFVVSIRPFKKGQKYPLFDEFISGKVSLDNLIMFTHQLTTMLEVGIPIMRALDILWKQTDNPKFQIAITQIKDGISQGKSLSEAFGEFPDIFPLLYRALLGVAETGANLSVILHKLTEYLNKQREFAVKVRRAISYPLFVVGFAILVVIGMLMWVVPVFKPIFSRIKAGLPLPTVILLKISTLMHSIYFWLVLAALSVLIGFLYKYYANTPRGKYKIDALKLKLPIFGKLLYSASIVIFLRSLTLLLNAGLPIDRSIETVRTTAVNKRISEALGIVKEKISEGVSLGNSLAETKIFSSFLVQIVSVGEESGTLIDMLEKASGHFEEDLDYNLNKFVTYLEPLLIIFVGGMVVFILLSIYLPIFRVWQGISVMK